MRTLVHALSCLTSFPRNFWANKRKGKLPSSRRVRRESPAFRPNCEVLEDRIVPTTMYWNFGWAPDAPTFSATAVSSSQINLSWNPVSNASGYQVDEWIRGAWRRIDNLDSSSTSCTITGLSAGATYYFDVGAYNRFGTSWADSQSATTLTSGPPAAPSFSLNAVSSSQINVSWNPVSGASSYLVDEWVNGAWTQIASLGGSNIGYAVTGLSAGATYSFEVAAVNSAGTTWANSKSATTLPAALAAPSFSLSAASSSQINVSWSPVSGASGYLVDEWVNGAWTRIANLGGASTGYAVNGLSANTTYSFRVAAANSAGTTWANSKSATTLSAALAAPSFSLNVVSSSQINVAWSPVSGASGYLVDEWVNGAWTQIASLGGGGTPYAVSGLSASTTYSFKVAAVNSASTIWANPKSATTSAGTTVTVDHPTAGSAYTVATGSLFGAGGPSYLDVHQGAEGDCWLLASLAEVAARQPSIITSMFTSLGTTVENGLTVDLYSVRLYDNSGTAHLITVDTELPGGGSIYDHPANGVLWVALAEKAYAQANGMGLVTTGNTGSDSYNALNGGDPGWALRAITGKPVSSTGINPSNIASAWNAGQFIVLCTSNPSSSLIVPSHCYAVVGYDPSSSSPFQIYNPWGTNSSGMALGNYNGHQVYGLFNTTATFLSQNFSSQSIGSGTENVPVSQDGPTLAEDVQVSINGPIWAHAGASQTGWAMTSNSSVARTIPEAEASGISPTLPQESDGSGSDAIWAEASNPDSLADFLGRSWLMEEPGKS